MITRKICQPSADNMRPSAETCETVWDLLKWKLAYQLLLPWRKFMPIFVFKFRSL